MKTYKNKYGQTVVMLTAYISEETMKELQSYAHGNRRSLSATTEMILTEYLRDKVGGDVERTTAAAR